MYFYEDKDGNTKAMKNRFKASEMAKKRGKYGSGTLVLEAARKELLRLIKLGNPIIILDDF